MPVLKHELLGIVTEEHFTRTVALKVDEPTASGISLYFA